jgi:CheY-like chemotaxis protein
MLGLFKHIIPSISSTMQGFAQNLIASEIITIIQATWWDSLMAKVFYLSVLIYMVWIYLKMRKNYQISYDFQHSDTKSNNFLVFQPNRETEKKPSFSIAENVILNKKPKLLIVDDNLELQQFLALSFSDEYEISLASNGEEGLNLVKDIHQDLILSDWQMPVMDGLEFCKKIKQTKCLANIPFVLLTSENLKDESSNLVDACFSKHSISVF